MFKERFNDWGTVTIQMQQVPVGLNVAGLQKYYLIL